DEGHLHPLQEQEQAYRGEKETAQLGPELLAVHAQHRHLGDQKEDEDGADGREDHLQRFVDVPEERLEDFHRQRIPPSSTPRRSTAMTGPIEARATTPKLSSTPLALPRTETTPTLNAMMNGTESGPGAAPPESYAIPTNSGGARKIKMKLSR